MLRRLIVIAGLTLGMASGAWAEFSLDSFVGQVKGQDVTFNVAAHNPGDVVQQGPIKIKVFSSTDGGNKWTEVQSWNVEVLPAGGGWNQQFTVSGEAAKARGKDYEAKIVVEMPGDERRIDKIEHTARIYLDK